MSKYYIYDFGTQQMLLYNSYSPTQVVVELEYTDGSGTISAVLDSSWGAGDFDEGDTLEPYTPLSKGVEVVDWIKEPDWWKYHYTTAEEEMKKYFSFGIKLWKLALTWSQLGALMTTFIYHIKPIFTTAIFMREDNTPIFKVDDYSYMDYVNVALTVGGDAYIPADCLYLKTMGKFYYKSPERQISAL